MLEFTGTVKAASSFGSFLMEAELGLRLLPLGLSG